MRYMTQCVIKTHAVSIRSIDRSIDGLMARCSLFGQEQNSIGLLMSLVYTPRFKILTAVTGHF